MTTSPGVSLTEPRIWITGANGLIGRYLFNTSRLYAPGHDVRAVTRADFDLLDYAAVERKFKKDKPQMVIHCAAISTVAGARENPEFARRVNVDATAFLAGLASDVQFVFFSTDLVFDGRKGDYSESDKPNPLHTYGETKLAAEAATLKNPQHLVVRTTINAGQSLSGNRAFNEQLRRSLQQSEQAMGLFTDEFRSPIPVVETARAAWELVQKQCAGIYHVAGAEKLSRLQIGEMLVKRWSEVTTNIKSDLAKDFPGPPRALDTSLNISKVQRVLSHPLPKFSEWLVNNRDEPI